MESVVFRPHRYTLGFVSTHMMPLLAHPSVDSPSTHSQDPRPPASKESILCAKLGSWLIDLIQKFLPCTKLFSGNWLYCCCLVAKLCPTLCYPMDCSPPGSPVHAMFQVRVLEWDAISFSRESSWPRDQTCISCTAGRFFTTEFPGKPHWLYRRV